MMLGPNSHLISRREAIKDKFRLLKEVHFISIKLGHYIRNIKCSQLASRQHPKNRVPCHYVCSLDIQRISH